MAAASAGSLQPGSAVTGIVPSSASSTAEPQLSSVLQQQQSQATQVLQQQLQSQHQNLQQFHQGVGHSVQRHPFVPRVGNGTQLNSAIGRPIGGNVESLIGIATSNNSNANSGTGMVAVSQQLQQSNAMIQRQPQMTTANAANLAPGWRRLISNNEVVYISPSGASLRTYGQIKDYLLSSGTCKCGLPCPLRPEYFFDFNSQVPNLPLQLNLDNGLTPRGSLMCLHQRRFLENQQNLLQKDIKRRKFNEICTTGKIITSTAPQCNSVAVYSGNVMQTSQIIGANGRMHMMAPQLVNPNQHGNSNISFQNSHNFKIQQQNHDQEIIQIKSEKQIGSVTISKTPPWRKNSFLQQQHNQHISQSAQITNSLHAGQVYSTNNERVPPLPQAHMCQPSGQQSQNQAPPWHHDQSQNRFMKNRSPLATKKKPNFKDDPTGYMDHQTAILHNSMLNVVQSPDLSDNATDAASNEIIARNSIQKQIPIQIKQEPTISVMQSSQNLYPQATDIEIKAEPIKMPQLKIETYSSTTGRNFNNEQSVYQNQSGDIEQNMNSASSNYVYSQQTRIIESDQSGNQQLLSNVPSSQQIIMEKNSQVIRDQYHGENSQQPCRIVNMSQATTTTIGGQTVTHYPNGMVQVEQNCDSIAPLKPQQQIQLQQQIQQQNILFRQNQQLQKSMNKANIEFQYSHNMPEQKIQAIGQTVTCTSASQESPVSSSTTINKSTIERRNTPDNKGPAQVGAISTSNQSPHPSPSPAESPESSISIKPAQSHTINVQQSKTHQGIFATSQTSGRNTITSVTAGKAITATTSVNDRMSMNTVQSNIDIQNTQKINQNNIIPVSGLQLQAVVREPGNQFIMTSTGQLILMSAQSNKSSNQMIINNPTGNNIVMNNQPNVLINQQNSVVNNSQIIGNSVDVLNSQSNTSSLVIQNSGIVQASQNIIQSPSNLITNNNSNFIVNSAGNIQPLVLNNSNLIQQNGQNLITANTANIIQNSTGSGIMTAGNNGTKVISNNQNILNNQGLIANPSNVINNQVLNNSGNVISPNGGGIIGQQAVVLNTLPNGYVIQPNFTTVDSQVVGQIVNQETNSTFMQTQQQRQIILTSPDSKRRAKKRKGSASSSPSTPSSLSPQQSPTIHQQSSSNIGTTQSGTQSQSTMVQITPQYPTQSFQISPGIQGIVVNKNTQNAAPQQQILFQNGQIIQPVNLIGQQLLVPAGLVMAPETTLVQIQNVGPCGSLITPQGMVLRAPSPQNKNFLSPGGAGQQFIVGGNSQMSPIGQIYGAPVSLVVPQSNSNAATFVQQNTTIVQQQSQQQQPTIVNNSNSTENSIEQNSQIQVTASPPDTTTHSPRSPERPPSERSGGSDMVQCVSSSEPDCVVSPAVADSAQSPSTTEMERSGSISYQTNVYKPSDAKMRKIDTPTQFSSTSQEISGQMKPDSHESPTNSPPASATSTTSSNGNNISSSGGTGGCGGQLPSFIIGELVWGAARGHPAWPGKILNPPDGVCTPSDSTWVQWFGGRPNIELVAINSLKSLSEGLEAHHKAQKDTRKSRKLNSQLERAIQEAMAELDRMSTVTQSTNSVSTKNRSRGRQPSNLGHQRTKPIKIAPAPLCSNGNIQQIRQQTITQVTHHQQSSHHASTTQTK